MKKDATLLTHLCAAINKRPRGRSRTAIAKLWPKLTFRRERRTVAFRYLRRFSRGPWLMCGSHVSRPEFGPMIAFPNQRPAYVDRIGKAVAA